MPHPSARHALPLLFLLACSATEPEPDTGDTSDTGDSDTSDTGDSDTSDTADSDTSDTGDTEVETGCSAALQTALEGLADWPMRTTCSGAFLSLGTAGETERLAFSWQLPDRPYTPGERFVLVWGGTDPDAVSGRAELQAGEHLLAYDCNDAILVEPVVRSDLTPTGGRATLTVTTWTDPETWTATIDLSDLAFTDADGAVCEPPDLTLPDLAFGWLPG